MFFIPVLFPRQQNGQHGFLHVQAVLGFIEDFRCVLLEHRRGDLLTPVGGQAVQHHDIGLGAFQQLAGELEAHKIPQALLTFRRAGLGGVPHSRCHHVGALNTIGSCVGSAFIGAFGVRLYGYITSSIFSIPAYIGPYFIYAAIGWVIAFGLSFVLSYLFVVKMDRS